MKTQTIEETSKKTTRKDRLRLFKKSRVVWLKKNLDSEIIKICRRNDIVIPDTDILDTDSKNLKTEFDWGNWRTHVKNRLHDLEDFLVLFPEFGGQKTELKIWLESYDLSILPLNLFQPKGVNKFIPRPGFLLAPDPYGVQKKNSVILHEQDGKKFYLATRKPGYATFLPILGHGASRVYCPMGCAGCYRGPQTRFNEPLKIINPDGSTEEVIIPRPIEQLSWLVKIWNSNPEFKDIYDILISGGEPMILPNETWAQILKELEKAKYLRSLRLCTGALFLGLPFRFDAEFIKLLSDFRRRTGVMIKIGAHVSHPENITPEAILFARRIIQAGIEILPQTPLEPGANFWENDLTKTEDTLRTLERLLTLAVGTRPYKWIIDMQGRRVSTSGGISITTVIELWRRLHDQHQGESDISKPTSLALFFPHEYGNLNLSFHSLWAIKKKINKRLGMVEYQIPHPAKKWIIYSEPLRPGINDQPIKPLIGAPPK